MTDPTRHELVAWCRMNATLESAEPSRIHGSDNPYRERLAMMYGKCADMLERTDMNLENDQ